MVTVARGLTAGSVLLVTALAALASTVGLGPAGWAVGLAGGVVLVAAVGRSGVEWLGPADLVTVARVALACAVAALVAHSFVAEPAPVPLLVLTAVALLLDAVDGRVARHTGTESRFGARFDGEADAFLLLVLSPYVAATVAPWVLAIGTARYAFAMAGWALPWLRDPLPHRYWRKVVTATQGIVLLVAAADVAPRWLATGALLVALGLLAESFGRDVVWLWRHRRASYDRALERGRRAAYPPGEFVGQESFMPASEILALAEQAGVAPGVSVLDLCCGVAGPGRFVTRRLGCTYLGVDESAGAIGVARERSAGLPCRFEVGRVPPVPSGSFDVVLLLETMLAFEDKEPLLRGVSGVLATGGRFAFTVEEGEPLTAAEADLMPGARTVWPVPLPELLAALGRAGLQVSDLADCSASHRAVVDRLVEEYAADRSAIAARIGSRAADDLLASHRLWSEWLGSGRVRKLALVAEKAAPVDEPRDRPVRTALKESAAGSAAGTSRDRSEPC